MFLMWKNKFLLLFQLSVRSGAESLVHEKKLTANIKLLGEEKVP